MAIFGKIFEAGIFWRFHCQQWWIQWKQKWNTYYIGQFKISEQFTPCQLRNSWNIFINLWTYYARLPNYHLCLMQSSFRWRNGTSKEVQAKRQLTSSPCKHTHLAHSSCREAQRCFLQKRTSDKWLSAFACPSSMAWCVCYGSRQLIHPNQQLSPTMEEHTHTHTHKYYTD